MSFFDLFFRNMTITGDPFAAAGIAARTDGAERDRLAPTMDSVEEEDATNPSFDISVRTTWIVSWTHYALYKDHA